MGQGAKRYYPAFLDLDGRLTIIVGSGRAAERKALQLSRYGADVTIITPAPSDGLMAAQADGMLLVEDRDYVRGDLAGASLVMCVSDDEEVRRAVAAEARQVGCPVNIAGEPTLSSFLVPGVVHREPLQIAVSTGGLSPELAKRVRLRVGEVFGDEWKDYAALVAQVRSLAAERLTDRDEIATLMDALLDSDVLDRMQTDEELTAEAVWDEFAPVAEEADVADGDETVEDTPEAEGAE